MIISAAWWGSRIVARSPLATLRALPMGVRVVIISAAWWGYYVGGAIISSYATGTANGGADGDNIGGLVGEQNGGSIISSYATGTANGGCGW